MKIWVQSTSALDKDQLWEPYARVLRKHVQETAKPGTTADVHGVEVMSPAKSWLSYAELLNVAQEVNNAIQAEREGYDAFVLLCMSDPGFYELRQVVNIPVVNAGETAFHMASLLAPKFALLAYNEAPLRKQTENARHYGFGERLVPSGAFGLTLTELQGGFSDPEPVLKGAREVARKAKEQGAAMLIPGCNCLNMILVANNIREVEGIPVLDGVGTAVKMAELLVELKGMGIDRSSLGSYTRVSKEELIAIRKLYGVEEKVHAI